MQAVLLGLLISASAASGSNPVLFSAVPVGDPATALELYGSGIRGHSTVTCTIAGVVAPVFYTSPQSDSNPYDQVNVALPPNLSGYDLPIVLTVDQQPSNVVTIDLAPRDHGDTVQRATALVDQMTLAEKIASLHGIQDSTHYRTVPGVDRLGIPALNITNGPAGATNGGPGHQGPATALPAPIALAATWDVGLAKLYGSIVGLEAYDLANGFLEGPDINIARVPQNGRTFEAFGEDPYLVGQMSANFIQGVQAEGVIGEAKHFAGNNQEANRMTINDIIDERTLREIYLPAFEASVTQGGAGAVMCAYNKVNGLYSCENDLLMTGILKGEWGFNGFITSDFGAVHSTVPSANAGLDVEMPTGIYFTDALQSAVQSGAGPMSVIDDKLIRRFSTMMRFGVFDSPPVNQPVPTAQNGALARQIAEAGMVLLKNDPYPGNPVPAAPVDPYCGLPYPVGTTNHFLPLNTCVRSIALIGPYATAAKTGGGGSSLVVPAYTVTPLAGIQNRAGSAVQVTLADGRDLIAAAALAKASDVAIVMVGDDEAEGLDHPISLSGNQDQLVAAVAAANPNTVVVVKSGAPVLMPWASSVPAILEAWYPGEEDGNAVAAVLFGDVNPSGKLPLTFPQNVADLPANTPQQYPGVNGVANYSEGVFVGYRHFDAQNIEPQFPFGHGLSYTSFAYSNLTVSPGAVEFDVTNTGNRQGAEVAQVYIGQPSFVSPNARPEPPKQLKGFQKVLLDPGQTQHVIVNPDPRAYSYWDVASHSWQVYPGYFVQVLVGSSSRDIRLRGTTTFQPQSPTPSLSVRPRAVR